MTINTKKEAKKILKRFNMECKIRDYVQKHFRFQVKSRIRRGRVSELVAVELQINLSPEKHGMIAKFLLEMGCTKVLIDGRAYWKNIAKR